MDASKLLLVGIEVSVAFAGFAGVIATFQFKDAVRIDRGDVVGVTMIVNFGLWCAFFFYFTSDSLNSQNRTKYRMGYYVVALGPYICPTRCTLSTKV